MAESRFNGKTGEYVRWGIGMVLAGLVAYTTAMSAIQRELAIVKATQEAQFAEVLRRLDVMLVDIRELRNREP